MRIENWPTLNFNLKSYTEEELRVLIEDEVENDKRATFVIRLHQRYCIVRGARERLELMEKLNGGEQ